LYDRKCDLTGKNLLSIYSSDKPYKVYGEEEWRSDKWSGFDYGKDVDLSKSFFQQYEELLLQVPKISNLVKTSLNCEYNVIMGNCKNCYMCATTFQSEDCLYSFRCTRSNACVDDYYVTSSENSYECFDVIKVYNLHFSESCENCADSYFLYDCVGCRNCLGCTGLRNKQYCFENKQLTKEEYEEQIQKFLPRTRANLEAYKANFDQLKGKQIRKSYT